LQRNWEYKILLSLQDVYLNNDRAIGVNKVMPKKNLSNLIQEETTKFTPLQGEPVIEVSAEAVLETQVPTDNTPVIPINNQLELEASIKELQKTVSTLKQKESTLIKQISDLQTAFSEKEALVERLTRELYETKQTALQLADSNSQLLEEIKVLKQPTQPSYPQMSQQASQISKSIQYKKSHRSVERLQEKPNQDSEDFSQNTWLYD
jgi:predicted RNase H-like nuclease (RuvC/YqgF family)